MRFWLPTVDVDSHVAFRARFTLDARKHVHLQSAGTGYYEINVDNNAAAGPARFTPGHPEYISTPIDLDAGEHLVTIRATHPGIDTRIQPNMPPFLDIRLMNGDEEIPLKWKGIAVPGYRAQTRRINPELGWIEWRDTREFNNDWTSTKFDDSKWLQVKIQEAPLPVAAKIAGIYPSPHALEHFDSGQLAEAFGYELDDIPARFFLRDLLCKDLPAQGMWFRFDLERVRLGNLWIGLDVPAGAVVEIAYAEALRSGRVAPYITLSAGPSCNMDHFVARGGPQTFGSLEPRGGRFVEVHVIAPPDKVKLVSSDYMERTYHHVSIGSFICNDDLLIRIWLMGRETYRACSEDAIIDNPTRERGQWTGDSYIGMETASIAFDDLRLPRRALVHAAENARADGLVSGMTPGNSALSSYAAQWVTACVRYHQLTGDKTLLDELFESAVHNLHAFDAFLKPEGLIDGLGWAFIDWGYQRAPGPIDLALNAHYLLALRAMQKWCAIHGWKDDAQPYAEKEKHISDVLIARLKKETFASLGYHAKPHYFSAPILLPKIESPTASRSSRSTGSPDSPTIQTPRACPIPGFPRPRSSRLTSRIIFSRRCSITTRPTSSWTCTANAGAGCSRPARRPAWKFSIRAGPIATNGRPVPLGNFRAMCWVCTRATTSASIISNST